MTTPEQPEPTVKDIAWKSLSILSAAVLAAGLFFTFIVVRSMAAFVSGDEADDEQTEPVASESAPVETAAPAPTGQFVVASGPSGWIAVGGEPFDVFTTADGVEWARVETDRDVEVERLFDRRRAIHDVRWTPDGWSLVVEQSDERADRLLLVDERRWIVDPAGVPEPRADERHADFGVWGVSFTARVNAPDEPEVLRELFDIALTDPVPLDACERARARDRRIRISECADGETIVIEARDLIEPALFEDFRLCTHQQLLDRTEQAVHRVVSPNGDEREYAAISWRDTFAVLDDGAAVLLHPGPVPECRHWLSHAEHPARVLMWDGDSSEPVEYRSPDLRLESWVNAVGDERTVSNGVVFWTLEQIWEVRPNGLEQLTDLTLAGYDSVWVTPDGSRSVVLSADGIELLDLAGGGVSTLLADERAEPLDRFITHVDDERAFFVDRDGLQSISLR